jgi:F-type H+-transporting ATPase subunit a
MASNPVTHVQDIPYLGIAEDFSILVPHLHKHDGHVVAAWDKPLLGGEAFPAYFTVHGFSLVVVAILLLYGAFSAVRGIKARPDKGRGVSSQLFEVLIAFIRDDVAKPSMGPYAMKYLPLVLTFFFFILFSNLLGMVPILITKAPTSNVNVTLCLALIVLGSMFVLGIKEQGMGHFVKNLVPAGLPPWILVLMYPIELLGPLTKSFALCVRLFANMVAGHIILAAFSGLAMSSDGGYNYISLIPVWGMSVAISVLEVFVAFLQAYVFTMLSAMFIGSFVHPDH